VPACLCRRGVARTVVVVVVVAVMLFVVLS